MLDVMTLSPAIMCLERIWHAGDLAGQDLDEIDQNSVLTDLLESDVELLAEILGVRVVEVD